MIKMALACGLLSLLRCNNEQPFTVSGRRMYNALFLDSHNILPKILPNHIKSIKFIRGNGEVGSIKQINFGEYFPMKYMKHRIEALDVENMYCKYTLIESDRKFSNIKSIVYEMNFADTDNGCICKAKREYHVKKGIVVETDDCRKGIDILLYLSEAVENYLLQHPDLSA